MSQKNGDYDDDIDNTTKFFSAFTQKVLNSDKIYKMGRNH